MKHPKKSDPNNAEFSLEQLKKLVGGQKSEGIKISQDRLAAFYHS